MSRSDAYHQMLSAASHIQHNVALILEAKAIEAARSSQWIVNHLSHVHFQSHDEQLKKTIEIHEQLIEVIEGITKMEQALAKNLSALLSSSEETGSKQEAGDLTDLFSFGDDSK